MNDNGKDTIALFGEIEASLDDEWGLGRRITKAAALIFVLSGEFRDVIKDEAALAGLCGAILPAFDIMTEAARNLAISSAFDLIKCSCVAPQGETVR